VALPGWVPFADQLTQATPVVVPTATTTVYAGLRVAGNLLVTPSACGATQPSVTLQNTGATAITWAAGSPGALGTAFAASATDVPTPTLSGQLAPGASVTLLVSGLSSGMHVVVIASGGTVDLTLPVC
jgi:hypothetical protein